MSADLLADLDTFYHPSPASESAATRTSEAPRNTSQDRNNEAQNHKTHTYTLDQNHLNLSIHIKNTTGETWPSSAPPEVENDDDEFGDFETAETAQTAVKDVPQQVKPESTIGIPSKREKELIPKNLDVLFDADEELEEARDEDEFGEFESVASTKAIELRHQSALEKDPIDVPSLIDFNAVEAIASIHPLATSTGIGGQPYSRGVFSPLSNTIDGTKAEEDRTRSRNLFTPPDLENGTLSKPTFKPKRAYNTIKPSRDVATQALNKSGVRFTQTNKVPPSYGNQFEEDEADAWDDFEETVPVHVVQSSKNPSASDITQPNARNVASDGTALKLPQLLGLEEAPQSCAPPTNIPPPALLISIFPSIIKLAKDELLEPLTVLSNDSASRDSIISQPTTLLFLDSYLSIAKVLAHIIACRKLRWKRDIILSQSMRIGPASSGRSGGMKLTSIDKGENVKEEREVTEVVRLWRAQVGRLRSIVKVAGYHLFIPEITETGVVKMLPESEGGIQAPKPCALCGLKRNERVAKVDVADVQDSFGEYWIEHWGHTHCFQFWEFYKHRLQ